MNDQTKMLLVSLAAVALVVIALLLTPKPCWQQYQTETAAIENCEGK
jgi:cell division protein FtsL